MKKNKTQPRVLLCGVTVDPPGATFGPRVKAHDELIWIMEGEARAHFGGRVLHAPEGSVLFRRAGVRDYYEWSAKGRTTHAYLHFNLTASERKKLGRIPALRKMPPRDILRPLFSYLLHITDLPAPLRDTLLKPAFELLWQAYVSGQLSGADRPAAALPEVVDRATKAIRDHALRQPPLPLKLADLAKLAHASSIHLGRLFKKSLGVSPLAYARLARLDRAAHQLLTTKLSIKDIALANGFYDAFHFSRLFKRTYGLSPKKFKHNPEKEWLAQRNPIIRGYSHLSEIA